MFPCKTEGYFFCVQKGRPRTPLRNGNTLIVKGFSFETFWRKVDLIWHLARVSSRHSLSNVHRPFWTPQNPPFGSGRKAHFISLKSFSKVNLIVVPYIFSSIVLIELNDNAYCMHFICSSLFEDFDISRKMWLNCHFPETVILGTKNHSSLRHVLLNGKKRSYSSLILSKEAIVK